MKKKLFPVVLAISVMLILSMTFAGNVAAKKLIIFAGGPAGGTFQVVAQSIATYKPVKAMDYNIKVQSSGGSTENLRKVNSRQSPFRYGLFRSRLCRPQRPDGQRSQEI